VINCFQLLLSNSTCAGTSRHTNLFCAAGTGPHGPAVDIVMTAMRSPDLPYGDVAVRPDAAIPHCVFILSLYTTSGARAKAWSTRKRLSLYTTAQGTAKGLTRVP